MKDGLKRLLIVIGVCALCWVAITLVVFFPIDYRPMFKPQPQDYLDPYVGYIKVLYVDFNQTWLYENGTWSFNGYHYIDGNFTLSNSTDVIGIYETNITIYVSYLTFITVLEPVNYTASSSYYLSYVPVLAYEASEMNPFVYNLKFYKKE